MHKPQTGQGVIKPAMIAREAEPESTEKEPFAQSQSRKQSHSHSRSHSRSGSWSRREILLGAGAVKNYGFGFERDTSYEEQQHKISK